MRRRAGVLAVVLAIGCHATEPLPEPSAPGSRTALFIGERGGETTFVSAYALDDDGRTTLLAPSSRAGDVWWFVAFACPPETLGVPEGPLTLLPEDEARNGWPLPRAATVRRLSPNALGTWTEDEPSEVVDQTMRRLPIDGVSACDLAEPKLDGRIVSFETPTPKFYGATFGTQLPDDRVFVSTIIGEDFTFSSTIGFASVTLDLDTQTLTEVEGAPGPVLAGYDAPDGELWLLTTSALYRGTADGGFVATATVPAEYLPLHRAYMVGRGAGDDVDLSITTRDRDDERSVVRRWIRYRGGTFELLAEDERDFRMPLTIFTDDDELLAIRMREDPLAVVVASPSGVRDEPLPRGIDANELRRLQDGRIAIRTDGPIFYWDNGGFSELEYQVPFLNYQVETDLGVTFVGNGISARTGRATGGVPRVAQNLPSIGTCEYWPFEGSRFATMIIPLRARNSLLTLEFTQAASSIRGTVITYVEGPQSCAL